MISQTQEPRPSSYENLWGLQLRRNAITYTDDTGKVIQTNSVCFKTPSGQEHTASACPMIVDTKAGAIASLIFSPVWITAKTIGNVLASLLDIITLGSISVNKKRVEDSMLGRLKGMGCSLLSIVATPANMAIEFAATVSHVAKPTANKIDLFSKHMWTGFVMAGKDLAPPHPDIMYMGPENKKG